MLVSVSIQIFPVSNTELRTTTLFIIAEQYCRNNAEQYCRSNNVQVCQQHCSSWPAQPCSSLSTLTLFKLASSTMFKSAVNNTVQAGQLNHVKVCQQHCSSWSAQPCSSWPAQPCSSLSTLTLFKLASWTMFKSVNTDTVQAGQLNHDQVCRQQHCSSSTMFKAVACQQAVRFYVFSLTRVVLWLPSSRLTSACILLQSLRTKSLSEIVAVPKSLWENTK